MPELPETPAFSAAAMERPVAIAPHSEVPAPLRASVERHQRHLLQLVQNLRTAGMDDETIEASISILIDSYRAELIAAIRALNQDGAVAQPC